MPEALLAPSFVPFVAAMSACFTAPSYATFQHIVAGWVLCVGRHTVTGVLRASGAVGEKHHTSFHRFFRAAAWQLEAIGLCLIPLVVKLLPADEPIVVSLDDTPSRSRVFDVLWYRAAGGRLLRFVLVRGWPGHKEDDVFCSTDLTLSAPPIIESYCLRWYLEVTFEETRGSSGSRTRRTAPSARSSAPHPWRSGCTP